MTRVIGALGHLSITVSECKKVKLVCLGYGERPVHQWPATLDKVPLNSDLVADMSNE